MTRILQGFLTDNVGFFGIGKKSAGFVLQFLRDVKADLGPGAGADFL